MRTHRSRVTDLAIMIGLFVGAWAIRAISADTFVTWDEPAWVFRSVKFLMALSQGRFEDTLLVGHPGVITMWSGALSLLWHRLVTGNVVPAQIAAVDSWAAFQVHDMDLLRELTALLPFAKSGILILHATLVAGAFGLMRAFLNRRTALAAALLLTLSPYHLALSRVLHIDALVSGFMLLCVLSLLAHMKRGQRVWLILSGLALGMAALSKAYGVLVALPGLSLLALRHVGTFQGTRSKPGEHSEAQAFGRFLQDALMWGLAAIVTFVALWPAMWTAPLEVVRTMTGLSFEYATSPGDATTLFFRGQPADQVGAGFYLVALLFRATPLALLGATLALLLAALPPRLTGLGRDQRLATFTLGGFAASYLLLVALAAKKFDRYVLPALLPLDVMAAVGVTGASELLLGRPCLRGSAQARERVSRLLPVSLVLIQAAILLLPLFPDHYLAYYSPLVGGMSQARVTLPVGWGEGLEEMSTYLADKPEAEDLAVAAWGVAGLAAGFPGQILAPHPQNLPAADYVLLYVSDVQNGSGLVERFHGQQTPEYVAHVAGAEYAWLYRNDYASAVWRLIGETALPGDAVVTNLESTVARDDHDAPPLLYLEGQSEAEIAGALERFRTAQGLRSGDRLFFVRFQVKGPKLAWLDRQLAQNGLYLWEEPFDYGLVRCYQLVENARFHVVQAVEEQGVVFEDALLLWGHGLMSTQVQYRQRLGIALGMEALAPIEDDLHVFIHLVDERGAKWGQRDAPLLSETHKRTSDWAPGEEQLVNLAMPLTPGVVPGTYSLVMGVYRLGDLGRLEARPVDGKALQRITSGTELALGTVEVLSADVPPEVEDLAIPHRIKTPLDEHAEVMGYALSARTLRPGDEPELTLWWRSLTPSPERRDLIIALTQANRTVTLLQAAPVGSHYTTERWRAGEILRYPHRFTIPLDIPGGVYDLRVGLQPSGAEQTLADAAIRLTQVTVDSPERIMAPPAIQAPMAATLGDEIAFLGYVVESATVPPAGNVQITLYWQALRRPAASYTVFTHLLTPDGLVHSQVDTQPVGGDRPTRGWIAGEYVIDSYQLPVGPDAPAGEYAVEIGMYDAMTGLRLTVNDDQGHDIAERRVLLDQTVQVAAP